MKRLFFKTFLFLAIIFASVAFYLLYSYYQFIGSAPDNKNEKKVVMIRAGESFLSIASDLEENGIITSRKKFYYLARLQKVIGSVKRGEYEFTTSMKPLEIIEQLVKGKVKEYKITIPEGYNIYQVAALLSNNLLANKDHFVAQCLDKNNATKLGLYAPSLEGYLFPDTYYFNKNMSAEDMISKMVANYKSKFTDEMRARALELNMSEHSIVTMASIIEKETSAPYEMPEIAGVFYNRLKKKMRLESDPTVIYGISDFDGNLRVADLRTPSPYNTYLIYGLPPAPIANPGELALKAALYPSDSRNLFFVSKNNGTHYFSATFDEHKKAVYKYQIKREEE